MGAFSPATIRCLLGLAWHDDMVFDASDETTLHSLVDPPRVGRLRHGANMQWIEMLLDVRL
jgi:hypothetical protein